MWEDDIFYRRLLAQCQSADLGDRMSAWRDLCDPEYLEILPAQFLLDGLNSTSYWQELSAIEDLMCLIKEPLPVDALMTILEDRETSDVLLRMGVAHVLAFRSPGEALDLFLRLVLSPEEDPSLRESMTEDLSLWEERVSEEILLRLLADPDPSICAAALSVLREWPPDAIPLETVVPYCTHEKEYVREAAIKALRAASLRVPPGIILAALRDPEPRVRAAASHSCISLVEWFGDQIPLEPLLEVLHDEYPAVREGVLDALGNAPHRAPVEEVVAALTDPVHYVRCAALETLGFMDKRVPASVYPVLREISSSDDAPNVRQRATRTLILLHGMQPPPLRLPIFDPTLEELGE
jgi:HEAT repeat protein